MRVRELTGAPSACSESRTRRALELGNPATRARARRDRGGSLEEKAETEEGESGEEEEEGGGGVRRVGLFGRFVLITSGIRDRVSPAFYSSIVGLMGRGRPGLAA